MITRSEEQSHSIREFMRGGKKYVQHTQLSSALPEKLRDAVELGFFQNLPYAEVSQILSIPVGTVKSRVFNAVAKLKEMLEKEGIRL